MMVLLTDEEYRALKFKVCSTCDTIKKELNDRFEAAQLVFVREALDAANFSASKTEFAASISRSLDKMNQSIKETS